MVAENRGKDLNRELLNIWGAYKKRFSIFAFIYFAAFFVASLNSQDPVLYMTLIFTAILLMAWFALFRFDELVELMQEKQGTKQAIKSIKQIIFVWVAVYLAIFPIEGFFN